MLTGPPRRRRAGRLVRLLAALAALTVLSALAQTWNAYRHRDAFGALEAARARADALDSQWREARLEWSTLAESGRVRAVAQSRLGLRAPSAEQTEAIALPAPAEIRP